MSILWSHWLLLFWTLCVLPHGFQIQSGSLGCTLSCLCAVILKVTTGVTPAFSTNRSVHCIKCIRHGWPGSSHMHRDLNHQCSGELLSGAWLSQTRYRLSYSAGLSQKVSNDTKHLAGLQNSCNLFEGIDFQNISQGFRVVLKALQNLDTLILRVDIQWI